MRSILLLVTGLIVITSCHKRVKTNDNAYLLFRDANGEVILTEEIVVDASRSTYMVLHAKSVSESYFLEKSNGEYSGEFEMYRFDNADYDLTIKLRRKGVGNVKMKGEFSGIMNELSNNAFTGQQFTINGTIELRE